MNWMINRFKEASTWRGIITLASIFGYSFSPEQGEKIITAAVALIGLLEVFRKERRPLTAPQVQEIVNDREPVGCVDPQSITSPESGRPAEDQP